MPVPVLGEIDAEGLREELGELRASASAAAGLLGERGAGRAREGIVETGTERQTSQLARADSSRRSDAFERGGTEMNCHEFEPAVDSPDGVKSAGSRTPVRAEKALSSCRRAGSGCARSRPYGGRSSVPAWAGSRIRRRGPVLHTEVVAPSSPSRRAMGRTWIARRKASIAGKTAKAFWEWP